MLSAFPLWEAVVEGREWMDAPGEAGGQSCSDRPLIGTLVQLAAGLIGPFSYMEEREEVNREWWWTGG